MKLTALDIRKQEFSRTLRGYDPDEVDSFIEVISDQWKEMVDELKRDNDRISELELKLEHYHKVEEALEEALQTARSSARQTIVQADVKAKKIIEAAEEDADKITRDARDHRRDIKREAAKFSVRRKEIVAKLRAFLLSEMEMLAHYDDDDPTGFIKLLGEVAGNNSGQQQPQLSAGSPVSEALDTEQQPAEEHRQTAPEPATEQFSTPQPTVQDPEYDYDEVEVHGDATEADEQRSTPVQPVELRHTRQEPTVSNQQRPEGSTEQYADSSAEQSTNETPVDEAASTGPDNNDSFHSEYERMASIQEVYGQFDPSTTDDAAVPDNNDAATTNAASPNANPSNAPSENYTEEDYADETYADESYSDDAYAGEDYAGDDYTGDITGDGYADPGQGTAAQGREYPNQSRPAQDRPPADSPAASGQRAPGMNRPDAHQELSESATEDIEKIRRILEDLDN